MQKFNQVSSALFCVIRQLKKMAPGLSAGAVMLSGMASVDARLQDQLPDIGTTAGATLSIGQELEMGDFYVRQMRARATLIHDPLLTEYINKLGNKLAAQASSVRTPFHFYLLRHDDINAYAFFGGNVVLYSALFGYAQNESELASVLAHEISHVTQRHLARAMEEQQKNAPFAWAMALGSVLLTMANPQAGIAALSATLAGVRQGVIIFTQLNEQEADRIGIQVLQRAGFDPQAMPGFMQILADQARYADKPPEMLLTHPLPASRLADMRNRAAQMAAQSVHSSQDYLFAKIRILGMYGSGERALSQHLLDSYRLGSARQQLAAKYGVAILLYREKKYAQALAAVQPMLEQDKNNLWVLDLITDILLAQNRPQLAVIRLQKAMVTTSNQPILQLNLANAYVKAGQPASASKLLYRYTFSHPDDPNGWDLLAEASAALGLRDEELSARAESLALRCQLDQAIQLLSDASLLVAVSSLKQARYDARIDQLRQLRQRYQKYLTG